MDTLATVTELVKVLAWPASVTLITVMLRRDLAGLVRDVRLQKAEVPGQFTVEFSQEIGKTHELQQHVRDTARFQKGEDVSKKCTEADRILRQSRLHPSPSRFNLDMYYDMVNDDPAAALVAIRGEIQAMINSILDFRDIEWSEADSVERKLRRLYDDRAINNHQYTLARSVLRLSNAAARDNTVTSDQAIEVLDATQPLIQEYMSWVVKDKDKLGKQGTQHGGENKRQLTSPSSGPAEAAVR